MNKTKLALCILAGALGLAALVLAYFTWSAFAAKSAALEGDSESDVVGLDEVRLRAEQLSKKPIYPCAASVKAIASNSACVVAWKDEALRLASRGDRTFAKTTAATFKAFLVEDAKRVAGLPGGVAGALAQPTFGFGPFQTYIAEGNMPAENDLPTLQRQWDDIATIAAILSTNGVSELKGVEFKTLVQPKEDPKTAKKNAKNKKGAKAKKAAGKSAVQPSCQTYAFTFTARPAALVRVLNGLETCERFAVVEDFSFRRERDRISEALGGEKKEGAEAVQTGSRRRRGRAAVAAQTEAEGEAQNDEKKNQLVTDPAGDEPLAVTLTVSVYDFRTLEEEAK